MLEEVSSCCPSKWFLKCPGHDSQRAIIIRELDQCNEVIEIKYVVESVVDCLNEAIEGFLLLVLADLIPKASSLQWSDIVSTDSSKVLTHPFHLWLHW